MDEVRLIAIEAEREGSVIRPDYLAPIIARAYPDSGFDVVEIAEKIRIGALLSGLRVTGK